jgi:F-type H+-transporting ATPase subunit a
MSSKRASILAVALACGLLGLAAAAPAAQPEHPAAAAASPASAPPETQAGLPGAVEHGAAHATGDDAHLHAEEGHAHDDHGGVAHLTNWLSIVTGFIPDEPLRAQIMRFQDPIFSGIAAILLAVLFARIYTRRSQDPGRLQVAAEMIVAGLYNLFEIILGPSARRFTPYLGTLFLFILVNNLMGIVPLMHASTSAINTTLALALCTFAYVQYVGIRENGPLGYLHHMAGSPRSGMEWGFALLLFPLHILGELIKPMSLSLRLFGNVFGEDTLIATMVVLGAAMFATMDIPIGLPLHVPFIFLALLTGTIQALVFTLLSTVYIALMLPHHEEALGHQEEAIEH